MAVDRFTAQAEVDRPRERSGRSTPPSRRRITAACRNGPAPASERGQARLRFERRARCPLRIETPGGRPTKRCGGCAPAPRRARRSGPDRESREAAANRGSGSSRARGSGAQANVVPTRRPSSRRSRRADSGSGRPGGDDDADHPTSCAAAAPAERDPKIAATPEFVNRSTLLPKRGPQAAAVTPTSVQPAPPLRVTPITQPLALPPAPQK